MSKRHTVISLFSGALGLDLGLEAAGFEVRLAVECNRYAAETIRKNRPDLSLVTQPLTRKTKTADLLRSAGLKKGEVTILTAGPSCQPFSTAGRRGSMDDPRGKMFHEFVRIVKEARPQFFVMENVRGIMSAAVSHRPLSARGPGTPPLARNEELGSAFNLILRELRKTGYHIVFGLVNTADYGTPQTRQRLVFLGSRDGHPLNIPAATHGPAGASGLLKWMTLGHVLKSVQDPEPEFHRFSRRNRRYMALVPEGGNWRDLPKRMQRGALGAAYESWGGRVGFLRRLSRKRPSPALTTCPDGRATMFCHPTELRPLSVREYAAIQQFPSDWQFAGSTAQKYQQIGNAVPIALGAAVGRELKLAVRRRMNKTLCGQIICTDKEFLRRLSVRPRTILNPRRMRKVKELKAAREWMAGRSGARSEVLKCLRGGPAARRPVAKKKRTTLTRRISPPLRRAA